MFYESYTNTQLIIINKSTKLSHLPSENQQQMNLLINIIHLMNTKFLLDISIRFNKTTPDLFSFIFSNSAHGMEDEKIDEQNQIGIRLLLKFNANLSKEKNVRRPLWSNTIATVEGSALENIYKQLTKTPALDANCQQPRFYLNRKLRG